MLRYTLFVMNVFPKIVKVTKATFEQRKNIISHRLPACVRMLQSSIAYSNAANCNRASRHWFMNWNIGDQ